MGRRTVWRSPLPWLLPVAATLACGLGEGTGEPAWEGETTTVVDPGGDSVEVPLRPARVLSLVPTVTETLLDLGAGDRLVGRTDYDSAAALTDLPSVGGGLRPSREIILSLRPDLVIHFAAASDVETPAFLDREGIPHFAVRLEGVEDVRRTVHQLGIITGRRPEADSLLDRMDRSLREVRERVAGRPPVRAAFLLGGSPPFVAGPGSFPGELIRLAGGVNVFDDLGARYAGVSPETLAARDIDMFLASPSTELDPRLTARAPVRRVSPAVELPGPRMGEAARSVARALHPEVWVDTGVRERRLPSCSASDVPEPCRPGPEAAGRVTDRSR